MLLRYVLLTVHPRIVLHIQFELWPYQGTHSHDQARFYKWQIHEIKPGAAIGFRNMGIHSVSDRYGNEYIRKPRLQKLKLNGNESASLLNVREDSTNYPTLGKLVTVAVDSGENGLLTADEFRTLTAPGSMEFISPEEISEVCVQELMGIGTGHNVLSAMQGSILNPGYRAGYLRVI